MSEKLTEITIDLDKMRDVSVVTEGSIIHVEARNRFPKLIGDVLKRGEETVNLLKREGDYKVFYSRAHEVIMLSGRRGAGKTTMLLHLLEEIEKCSRAANGEGLGYGDNNTKVYNTYKEIYPLGIFDPTLLGGREHLLAAILVKICNAVDNSHQKRRISAECYANREMGDFDKWRESLRNMADGLKVLGESEGNRSPSSIWEDSQFVLDESLKRAQHGEDLERKFQRFVDNSLKILEKKAFIIGLDDIDTQPGIGMHVLEVLRKYLTTPQLITILSGDIELYSSIIRKGQLDAFGIQFDSDDKVLDRNERMISGLVDQYMNKLLPSRNRIHISYVNKCIEDKKIYIRLQNDDPNDKTLEYELVYFTEELIKKIFCTRSQEDVQAIKNVIFDNPARSVMQLLIVAAESVDKKNSISCNKEKLMTDEKNTSPEREEDTSPDGKLYFKLGVDFSSHLADIFYESLHRFGYTYADFENLATLKGMGRFLDCLVRKNLFGDAPSMQLRNAETWINEAMLVILAGLTRTFAAQPALSLVYAFHVYLPQEILPRKDYEDYLKAIRLKEHFQDMWDLVGLTPNAMAYLHTKTVPSLERSYFLGTTCIMQNKNQETPIKCLVDCRHDYDYKLYPILALSLDNIQKEDGMVSYISIYSIIKFFTYTLSLSENQMSDKIFKRRILDLISENILPLQYSDKIFAFMSYRHLYREIIDVIMSWKKLLDKHGTEYEFPCSPLFISKFMKRFIKKMQILDNCTNQNCITKEMYMSNIISYFLNSIYIEECEIRNLNADEEPFILEHNENMSEEQYLKFIVNVKQSKLFLLVMTFPLLKFFVNRDLYVFFKRIILDVFEDNEKFKTEYDDFKAKTEKLDENYKENIYKLLCTENQSQNQSQNQNQRQGQRQGQRQSQRQSQRQNKDRRKKR